MLSNKPRMGLELIRYGLTRRGAFGLTSTEICGFLDSRESGSRPDIQINYRPFSFDYSAEGGFIIHPFPGGTASICFTRPKSRGDIRLLAENGGIRLAIQPNYLDRAEDVQGMLFGYKILRKIVNTAPIFDLLDCEHG